MTPFTLKPCIKRYFILICFALYSAFAFAQTDILSNKIDIPKFKGELKDLLSIIEKENVIVFAYSSNVLLNYEVQFQESSLSLNDFLTQILKGKNVGYKISGTKIILYPIIDSGKSKLKQTVRGTILDEDSRLPLIGATVSIPESDPIIGTITDVKGNFRLENIPVGRINFYLSYLGYEEVYMPSIEVNSGKEVVLNLVMRQSALKIDEVTVNANRRKGEAINELSLLSARSISVEETKRFTGGMDDPARMVTSYAGVNASPDGSSDIIVRGNSPKYMQWRVDGVEITSPYHMDDQNASFGAITVLNKSLLTTSDFYTGAFAPEYGNVLSNVMDVKLRNGNNEKFEATVGVGLMGTDISLEGPIKKGYGGSYLVNYRYSTIGLMKDLGLLPGVEGVVSYQDATFKAVLPSKKLGTFSVLGLAGLSGFSFKNVDATGISTPGAITDASILKDYDKEANLLNFALTNTKSLTKSSYLKTSISYAANGFDDDLFEKRKLSTMNGQTDQNLDSTGARTQTFESKIDNSQYQIAMSYNNRLNAKNKIQIGSKYINSFSDYYQNIYMHSMSEMVNVNDFKNDINSLTNFISWKYSLNDRITFVTGIHNMNVLLNKKSTVEPRIAMNWHINNSNSIHAGYGKHSTAEKVHNYFTKVLQPDGSYNQPNKNLDLLKADHYVLGYEKRFTDNLIGKVELYYQNLYDLPVEDNDTSYFCTINESYDYKYVALVNEGVGKNYGVELTLERFFDNSYYFLFNGTLYESKYKSLEGEWRNTLYNGNYIVNFLFGKEFKNIGKKKNKTLALNTKAYFGGGQRYLTLLRDENGNVIVDPENNQFWDYSKAYNNNLVHIYNVNFSISYKINKANSTHEIFLDLMNVINGDAKLSEYYDESQPDNVGYEEQMIFLPNIMYRVYF